MQGLRLVLGSMGLTLIGSLMLSACGSSSPSGMSPTVGLAEATITIDGFTFTPDPITVAAGSSITVVNKDTAPHTATSEVAAKDYAQGAATGGFSFNASVAAGGTATITVPTGLTSGTSLPYFCNVHKSMMKNPDPTIVIK
jgi:plastocyanin